MVVVINGEILPDNDPRAVSAREQRARDRERPPGRAPSSAASGSASPRGGVSARLPFSSYFSGAARSAQSVLGLESGRTVTLPAVGFLGKPAIDVPVYVLVVAALLVALLGVQGAVFVALIYLFYTPWTHDGSRDSSAASHAPAQRPSGTPSPQASASASGHRRQVLGAAEKEARMQRLMQQQSAKATASRNDPRPAQ
ncbi:hypothetical protein BESB_003300 [Besnoitia besnoiti]|uniref:Transmembrane protein n=1 Tax=Besnoitia besnoiti TaxID=94643 RepID=A0A2A9MJA0_BESBE|nr:hypothetical protein BESB_003300 [Besnoitia besnoiti]PFH37989.1 hypothetical protein BESB_003300 [Besnoitia besnoiti]